MKYITSFLTSPARSRSSHRRFEPVEVDICLPHQHPVANQATARLVTVEHLTACARTAVRGRTEVGIPVPVRRTTMHTLNDIDPARQQARVFSALLGELSAKLPTASQAELSHPTTDGDSTRLAAISLRRARAQRHAQDKLKANEFIRGG